MTFEIIEPKYDELNKFVYDNSYGTIFQTSHFLEIFKDVPNCEPFSMAAIDKNGNIISSLVGVEYTEKEGIIKKVSTHSTIRGGPIFIPSEIGLESAINLVKKYNERKNSNSIYTHIYPFFKNDLKPILSPNGYNFEPFLNYLMEIDSNEDKMWSALPRKRRYAIRKAIENNLQIKEVGSHKDLVTFYELLMNVSKRNKILIKPFKLFENIYNLLTPYGLANIYIAIYNDIPIAGILTLNYKNVIYDWYACSNLDYTYLSPNEYLIWHVLSFGSKNNYTLFDFGGGGKPNEPYGVREFKKRFGGIEVNYGYYELIQKTFHYKLAKIGHPFYLQMKKYK